MKTLLGLIGCAVLGFILYLGISTGLTYVMLKYTTWHITVLQYRIAANVLLGICMITTFGSYIAHKVK